MITPYQVVALHSSEARAIEAYIDGNLKLKRLCFAVPSDWDEFLMRQVLLLYQCHWNHTFGSTNGVTTLVFFPKPK